VIEGKRNLRLNAKPNRSKTNLESAGSSGHGVAYLKYARAFLPRHDSYRSTPPSVFFRWPRKPPTSLPLQSVITPHRGLKNQHWVSTRSVPCRRRAGHALRGIHHMFVSHHAGRGFDFGGEEAVRTRNGNVLRGSVTDGACDGPREQRRTQCNRPRCGHDLDGEN
jgi:hypothetical protein